MPTNDDERDFDEERAQAQAVEDEQRAEAAAEEDDGPWYVGFDREHAEAGNHEFETYKEANEFVQRLRKCGIWSHRDLFPDEDAVTRKLRLLGFRPMNLGGIQGMAIEVPLGAGENPDVKALVVTALLGKILEQIEEDEEGETEPEDQPVKP